MSLQLSAIPFKPKVIQGYSNDIQFLSRGSKKTVKRYKENYLFRALIDLSDIRLI